MTDEPTPRQRLDERIRAREARVGVVGLGYVGLPVAVRFAEVGFPTVGFDVDPEVVESVSGGRSHVMDVADRELEGLVRAGRLEATGDFGRLEACDAVLICVPTPLSKTGDPDVSHIVDAVGQVSAHPRTPQLVVLESTTYPGTTRELLGEELEANGRTVGEEVFVAFSPERIDPGNAEWTLQNTPKVVSGLTDACHGLAVALYGEAVDHVVEVSRPEAAELTKILENTFRAVNIGLANEMAMIADRLGVDAWEVIEAADTKPYGFMKFVPGPGLGGHCIPVDPQYLSWKMRSMEHRTRFIELADEVNTGMPRWVVGKVAEALNDAKKPVNGSRVLLLGAAYKPDVDDTRESPALDVLELLDRQGADVAFHDPHVEGLEADGERWRSVELTDEELEGCDCAVVVTDHRRIDWRRVAERAPVVVDARNALEGIEGPARIYPLAGPPRGG